MNISMGCNVKNIIHRIKILEASQKKGDDVKIVEAYLRLIELSIAGDPILETPDFAEFRQMQIKGG